MKAFEGVVLTNKMQNTTIIEVVRRVVHPLYKKVLKKSRKFKVDTNGFSINEGDKVRIIQTKPISKEKHFKVLDVLNHKKTENINVQDIEKVDIDKKEIKNNSDFNKKTTISKKRRKNK